MVDLYPDFYNDVFGPIMQPGSSSHFAGPCRIGLLARSLLGEEPVDALFTMAPDSSWAGAFGLMKEDLGMLGGILGFAPDDRRLFDGKELARSAGLAFEYRFGAVQESRHPNAIKIGLRGRGGRSVELVGDSTGGGMVECRSVDGHSLSLRGDCPVLFARSGAGTIDHPDFTRLEAGLPGLLEAGQATDSRGRILRFWKLAGTPELGRLRALCPGLRLDGLEAILPVVSTSRKQPQLFDSMSAWRGAALTSGKSL